jgi:hypothetical protein
MWSLEVIDYLNQQAARKARKRHKTPLVPDGPEAVEDWLPLPFPSLGNYDPPGWERTEDSWFVDKTGWGRPDEPALTWDQLKDQLQEYIAENPAHGFAITEEGQSTEGRRTKHDSDDEEADHINRGRAPGHSGSAQPDTDPQRQRQDARCRQQPRQQGNRGSSPRKAGVRGRERLHLRLNHPDEGKNLRSSDEKPVVRCR